MKFILNHLRKPTYYINTLQQQRLTLQSAAQKEFDLFQAIRGYDSKGHTVPPYLF